MLNFKLTHFTTLPRLHRTSKVRESEDDASEAGTESLEKLSPEKDSQKGSSKWLPEVLRRSPRPSSSGRNSKTQPEEVAPDTAQDSGLKQCLV